MEEKIRKPAEGNCIISEEVLASIASTAALEIAGVASMGQQPSNIRNLVRPGKSVRVLNDENQTVLDVYVNLFAGAQIQQTGAEVQKAVKSAVQSMTGKPVTRVNVHVSGIVFEEKANG